MGTWGSGPFDSDLAADFVDGLAGLTARQTVAVLQKTLRQVADAEPPAPDPAGDGVAAVAAAALVASRLGDGTVVIDADDGPDAPLPQLPASLRQLALQALDRVTEERSGLAQSWVHSEDARAWRRQVQGLRDALWNARW